MLTEGTCGRGVLVPEASVNENYALASRKDDVRFARKRGNMYPVSVSGGMKESAYR
jgi:hypothetical protein